jgi:hypothetical protein
LDCSRRCLRKKQECENVVGTRLIISSVKLTDLAVKTGKSLVAGARKLVDEIPAGAVVAARVGIALVGL